MAGNLELNYFLKRKPDVAQGGNLGEMLARVEAVIAELDRVAAGARLYRKKLLLTNSRSGAPVDAIAIRERAEQDADSRMVMLVHAAALAGQNGQATPRGNTAPVAPPAPVASSPFEMPFSAHTPLDPGDPELEAAQAEWEAEEADRP